MKTMKTNSKVIPPSTEVNESKAENKYERCSVLGSKKLMSHLAHRRLRSNPSLKLSPNGVSPSPVWRYAVHFRQSGLGATPSVPA